ncbi:MAG: hypothetical protein KBF89_07485 [Acidimicrobiia bacterium]|nr:hypothetical protein [Acidimicrobiia bacterium]
MNILNPDPSSISFSLIPGFGLTNTMYSSLDIYENARGIEIEPKLTWEHNLEYISGQLDVPTIVIGYSQGARLAIGTAIEYPENILGLIIISGNAGIENDHQRKERCEQDIELSNKILKQCDKNGNIRNEFWDSFDNNKIFDQDNQEVENLLKESRINESHILVEQLMNLSQGVMPNYNERISELKVPIMFCSGIRDEKYSVIARSLKKKTAFSHHILFDSDHRIPLQTPNNLSISIEWFANNIANI